MHPIHRASRIANKFRSVGLDRRGIGNENLVGAFLKGNGARVRADAGTAKPADAAVGELFIYEAIGWDCWTGSGITGKTVAEALDALKGVKTLNVYINCEGGDVFEAKAIYSQLKRFDAEKVVHIDGIAASAATFIAMAGDKIITSPVATWMVHQAWSGAMGRAEDMRAMADLLDLENGIIAQTYASRTGGTPDEMLALMSAAPDGTWMDAAKALELGFTDEIGPADDEDETDDAEAPSNRSKAAAALALTQRRLNNALSDRMAAKAAAKTDMHRRTPGQPGNRPASR